MLHTSTAQTNDDAIAYAYGSPCVAKKNEAGQSGLRTRAKRLIPHKLFLKRNAIRGLRGSAVACAIVVCLLSMVMGAQQPNHPITIRVLNAQTNKPVIDERLNIALRADQIGSVPMPTDKNGLILVDTGHATTIRILANMYADCRPRGELYIDYALADIRHSGLITGNLCSSARPTAHPGELILFVTTKTYIPSYPNGPLPERHLP